MGYCVICDSEFYNGGTLDPVEPCICGERVRRSPWTGKWKTLWYHDKHKAIFHHLRYKLAQTLLDFGDRLYRIPYGS